MSILIAEKDLPVELSAAQSVEAAYAGALAEAASKLQRGLPVLVECDKDLAPYILINLRDRFKDRTRGTTLQFVRVDGNLRDQEQQGAMPVGLVGAMINQLRDAVRGAVEK